MSAAKDPCEVLFVEDQGQPRSARRDVAGSPAYRASVPAGAAIGRLQGFALDDQPLVGGLDDLPGEIVAARSTVSLMRSQIGCRVVVVFEQGEIRRPIVLGVLQEPAVAPEREPGTGRRLEVEADEDRLVLSAERQITLRCGEASITLTRAGKVILRGTYVVSRSSGCNRIKGAVVDIN
jgi:hypothetical protein